MMKLQLKPDQQVWATSDWHFQHVNLCRGTTLWPDTSGCRDFDTLEEMNETIINNFNKLVKPTDIVFHLGDVIFGDKSKLPEFMGRLSCKNIYLVMGNHDSWILSKPEMKSLFLGVYEFGLEVAINKKLFVLCHYALKVWQDCHRGSIHAYGHSHSSLPDDVDAYSLDVGVDSQIYGHKKYTPFSLDELLFIMHNQKAGKFKPIDHHR